MCLSDRQDEKNEKIKLQFNGKSPIDARDVFGAKVAVHHGQILQILDRGNVLLEVASEEEGESSHGDANPISWIQANYACNGKRNGALVVGGQQDDKTAQDEKHVYSQITVLEGMADEGKRTSPNAVTRAAEGIVKEHHGTSCEEAQQI